MMLAQDRVVINMMVTGWSGSIREIYLGRNWLIRRVVVQAVRVVRA
jgi:hypothetical protein